MIRCSFVKFGRLRRKWESTDVTLQLKMQSLSHQNLSGHNLIGPTSEELNALREKYGFHELDIEDCLSEHERPKIDEYENYLFLVLHIPYFNPVSRRVVKEEVHIFVGKSYIITLHEEKLQALNTLWDLLLTDERRRAEYLGNGAGFFLYELVNAMFQSCFPVVDGITKKLRELEPILFEEEREEKVLRTVLELKRSIISMRRILLPQRMLVASLEHKSKRLVGEDEELTIYFDDIIDAIERQWALLETAKEVINALQESFESWIQHKTNRIIRVLTIFSVTMLPLTVFTGLYGMNVELPLAHEPYAFLVISFTLIAFLVASITYFGWKKWL